MKYGTKKALIASVGIFSLIALSAPVYAQYSFLGNEIAIGGEITLKSGNVLIVRNGAVDTRIIVGQDSRFIDRNNVSISYSALELGDRIQAFGILLDTRTLQADTIRDLVLPTGNAERTITGTVSEKLGNRLTIRSGGSDIDIFLDQDTLIVDRIGHRISLSGLEIGDRVQAFGAPVNGVIEADTLTNLSIAYNLGGSSLIGGALPYGYGAQLPATTYAPYGYGLGNTYAYTSTPPVVLTGSQPSPQTMTLPAPPNQNVVPPTMPAPYVTPPVNQEMPSMQAESQTQTAQKGSPIQIIARLLGRSGNSFTVMSGGETWTIHYDQHTFGFDKDNSGMSFARMRTGDTLQIAGQDLDGHTISADAIRDLSVSFASINAANVKKVAGAKK